MNKEYIEEIKQFINENNMNDIFIEENQFYNLYNCNLYVYIRVSTESQDFGRQILELYEWAQKKGIKIYIDHIFCDKYTGKKTTRKQYEEMHNLLRENDYIVVSELNRLGRNWDNTKKEWEFLDKENINPILLDNETLSAKLPNEEKEVVTLENKLIRGMLFIAINYVASKKIEEVSRSTKDGIKKARLAGKQIGRPSPNTNSSNENLINTLKLCINENIGYRKACLQTRYPIGSLTLRLKQIREKYNVKNISEILEILESEEK